MRKVKTDNIWSPFPDDYRYDEYYTISIGDKAIIHIKRDFSSEATIGVAQSIRSVPVCCHSSYFYNKETGGKIVW